MARRITDVAPRHRVEVTGVVVNAATARWRTMDAWVCSLDDGTGIITVVFGGRRPVPGIVPGARVHVEGTAQAHDGALALWNPVYEFVRRTPAGQSTPTTRLASTRPEPAPIGH